MKYQIILHENGRYMDDEGRYDGPAFASQEEAIAAAKAMVDDDLRSLKQPEMAADELFSSYTMFGVEPQIVSAGGDVNFSAWAYAKTRCEELCGEGSESPTADSLHMWFVVESNDAGIQLKVAPPGRERWAADIRWTSIIRVCFKTADFLESDEIYIFTSERPESYSIPVEAHGGADLWAELIRRGFFDAETAIRAAASTGRLFCWPAIEEGTSG